MRKRALKWQKKNLKRARIRKRLWRQANPQRSRQHSKRYYTANRTKRLDYGRSRYWNNPKRAYWEHVFQEYRLTRLEWLAIFKQQGRRCAICKITRPGARRWHTDHNHRTGKVRGILCGLCNIMLGGAKDNPKTLAAGIEYLRKHS